MRNIFAKSLAEIIDTDYMPGTEEASFLCKKVTKMMILWFDG